MLLWWREKKPGGGLKIKGLVGVLCSHNFKFNLRKHDVNPSTVVLYANSSTVDGIEISKQYKLLG